MKKKIILFLMILFLILLIYSGYRIITYLIGNKENKSIQDSIKINYIKIEKDDNIKEETYKIDFNTLKEQNSDTVAYLKVNGTNIDYIVVKGNDNSYYLKHNFNKNWNVSGWIFADYRNKFDNTDKNIIIYGHNTKDGSMFGTLKNVLNESFRIEDNLKITLTTEERTYYYQVFSTYTITPEDYYIETEFTSDTFKEFINKIKSRSNYDYNVSVSENDKILTLSSCTANGTKRVVLHAKLIV